MGKKPTVEIPEIFLGEWLKLLGVGATAAAKIAGCSQSYISNISGGRRENVNALYLLRLSDHLGIKVNDFYQKPPSAAAIEPFADISPEARTAVLNRRQRRA